MIYETWKFIVHENGTKMLGFAQVTFGVLATSDVFEPKQLKWIILLTGLLTAWRGFFNTSRQDDPEPTTEDPRDAPP